MENFLKMKLRKFFGSAFWVLLVVFLISSPLFSEPFTFVVLGDSRDGDLVFQKIIKQIQAEPNIAFVIHTGDAVPTATDANFEKYLSFIAPLKNKWYQVIGNHDLYTGGFRVLSKYFPQPYFYFEFKNNLFIILNNAFDSSFNENQYYWLKDLLSEKGRIFDRVFVMLHQPLFDPTGFNESHSMNPAESRQKLLDLLKTYKIAYVIAGHIHAYGRQERDGTVFLVTGGAGAPLHLLEESGGFYHYIKMTVDGPNVKEEVVRIAE